MRASALLGGGPDCLVSLSFAFWFAYIQFLCCTQWAVIYSDQWPHETDPLPPPPPSHAASIDTEHSQAERGCQEGLPFTAKMSAILFCINAQDFFFSIFKSLFSLSKLVYLAHTHHS